MSMLLKNITLKDKLLLILYQPFITILIRRDFISNYMKGKIIILSDDLPSRQRAEGREVNKKLSKKVATRYLNKWLPEFKFLGKFYYALSTFVHVINFITCIVVLTLDKELANGNYKFQDGNLAIFCYTFRFTLHKSLGPFALASLSFMFSLLHLFWRFLIIFLEREFAVNVALFLLMDEDEIENASDPKKAQDFYIKHGALDPIQNILFYKVEDRVHNVVEFRLRPNRTIESRETHFRVIEIGFKASLCSYLLLVCALFPTALYQLTTDQDSNWIGCEPNPDANLLYFFRYITSFVLSLVMTFDGVGALLYGIIMTVITLLDILGYWRTVEFKLDKSLKLIAEFRAISGMYMQPDILRNNRTTRERCLHDIYGEPDLNDNNHLRQIDHSHNHKQNNGQKYVCRQESNTILGKKIYELQCIISDFFEQLQMADKYVSIGSAFAFSIWLMCNFAIGYVGLKTKVGDKAIVIRSLQFLGFMVILTLAPLILHIKRKTEPAYRTICSLMAFDPSMDKRRWANVLKYYTVKQRHAFTILHLKIFTLGILLKLFFYTFIFVSYIHNLRNAKSADVKDLMI